MITWIERNGLVLGTFTALEAIAPDLRVYFTTRSGGVSLPPRDSLNLGSHVGDIPNDVRENRRRLGQALSIGPGSIARGGQVHGTEIAVVTRGGKLDGTDGFITGKRELVLAINSADCFPLILHSPSEMVVAALHVGRSGAAGGIIGKTFGILRDRFRIDPENTIAVCGPGICLKCYEVGEEIAMTFPSGTRKLRSGKWHLDLPRFIRSEIEREGVKAANWFDSRLCTACEQKKFFSYRRDGGKTGRHWMLASLAGR